MITHRPWSMLPKPTVNDLSDPLFTTVLVVRLSYDSVTAEAFLQNDHFLFIFTAVLLHQRMVGAIRYFYFSFYRRNLECPWRTLLHYIYPRRWLGRRYYWPRPGESISSFHCYLIYDTLFALLTYYFFSASHSARTMCIPIIELHIIGTTIIRKFWVTACAFIDELSDKLSYPTGLIIRQIMTTEGW